MDDCTSGPSSGREGPRVTLDEILSGRTLGRLGDALILIGEGSRIIDANDAALALYAYSREEMLALTLADIRGPRFLERVPAEFRGADGLARVFHTEHFRSDGTVIPVEVRAVEVAAGEGTVVLCAARDISSQVDAEVSLLLSHARLDNIAATVPGVLYEYEVDPAGGGRYVYVGPGCQGLLGLAESEMRADVDPVWGLVHADDIERVLAEDEACEGEGVVFNSEFRIITPAGELKWLHMTSRQLPSQPGKPDVWCGIMLDITERKNAEQELRRRDIELARLNDELVRQAATDSLTGLATRRHFYDCLDRGILEAERDGCGVSVASFDLDGLKRVNDTGGHARGDHVLVSFAAILDDQCRREDVAGRLGGDEFSVAMPRIGADGGRDLATRVVAAARANPLLMALDVTASAGVAEWRPGERSDDVLQRADAAMYAAKRSGGDSVGGTQAS